MHVIGLSLTSNNQIITKIRKAKNIIFISIIFFLSVTCTYSQTFGLQGQLSGWTTVNPEQSFEILIGLRYIPVVSIEKNVSEKYSFDAEVSLNMYGSSLIHTADDIATESKIKPYRMWFRFSTSQFEVRIGLQKINFGSATLLRPLMWFDSIDPRDPLQLTDGVYGILGRYYFLNNINIWLWGLYGNDETKGWEFIPSDKNKLEYGGRLQVPLFTGEIAMTYHHRSVDLGKQILAPMLSSKTKIPENRLGLDGKWDIEIGLWFELALVHQDVELSQVQFQRLTNLGVDYTFNFGNGLNVMTEYFTYETSEKVFDSGEGISFSALSLNYPFGLIDNLTVMVYYDWDNHNWYRFINWQQKYDNWSLYLMGFWNPERFQIYQARSENNLFGGKGFQLMVVVNH